jgi:hypothetical protein
MMLPQSVRGKLTMGSPGAQQPPQAGDHRVIEDAEGLFWVEMFVERWTPSGSFHPTLDDAKRALQRQLSPPVARYYLKAGEMPE